jgi:hypothetical protein
VQLRRARPGAEVCRAVFQSEPVTSSAAALLAFSVQWSAASQRCRPQRADLSVSMMSLALAYGERASERGEIAL